MRRYLLFAGAEYYPAGGWDDFVDHYNDLNAAKAKGTDIAAQKYHWFHIVDTLDMKTISEEVSPNQED